MGLFDFFKKNKTERDEGLAQGLEKTKTGILGRITKAFTGKNTIDDEVLDQLEETLLLADVGVDTTVKIIDRIRNRVARDKYSSADELNALLRDEIADIIRSQYPGGKSPTFDAPQPMQAGKKVPYVILVVGVNGVGKTTTIGKLAWQFQQGGYKVVLGAADTFRAAAVEQLRIWSQRVGCPIVELGMNTDPGAVAYQAVEYGVQQGADVVIVDTAGRLHNKKHLMAELGKVSRVMTKLVTDAPHETLLVLDGSTGQNALQQAREFMEVTSVSALAVTKLDGTAKGGIVLAIADQLRVPVKYIGVGEKMTDLQLFDPDQYVGTLFGSD
jgi:fused signal recognition particle receptor